MKGGRGSHSRGLGGRVELDRTWEEMVKSKRDRVRKGIPLVEHAPPRAVGLAERERTVVPEPSRARLQGQYKSFVSRLVSAEVFTEYCAPMIGVQQMAISLNHAHSQ